jgi:hypothetical protein
MCVRVKSDQSLKLGTGTAAADQPARPSLSASNTTHLNTTAALQATTTSTSTTSLHQQQPLYHRITSDTATETTIFEQQRTPDAEQIGWLESEEAQKARSSFEQEQLTPSSHPRDSGCHQRRCRTPCRRRRRSPQQRRAPTRRIRTPHHPRTKVHTALPRRSDKG